MLSDSQNSGLRGPLVLHPPAAAGDRGRALQDRLRLQTGRRPAPGHRRAHRRARAPGARPGPAGRHRLGQDLHHGPCHPASAAPDPDPGAEQDAGRPALWRDEELLSRERGGVFRLLLRLLPARGLCAADRHLYREGKLDQRADRPDAPFGNARAVRAARRDHRRLGLLHLRHRLARDLFDHDRDPHRRAARSTARSSCAG